MDARDSDRLAALGFLARYGLGKADELTVGTLPDMAAAMDALRHALAAEVQRVGPEAFVVELERLVDEAE